MASYIHCGPTVLSWPEMGRIEKSLASNLAKGMSVARKTTPQTMAGHLSEKLSLRKGFENTELDSLWKTWISLTLR